MEAGFYAEYARVEATHWWFRGRRAILRALLPTLLSSDPDTRILDLGFGTGTMLQFYEPYGAVIGCDMSRAAIDFARTRTRVPMVQGVGEAIPLRDATCDLVSMLDVIEHVEDDIGLVREGARCLKPGGVLLAAVPAFRSLWGVQDTLSRHQRRYRLPEIAHVVQRAGLDVERATYCNTLLFPPIAAVRLARRLLPARNGAPEQSDFEMTQPGRLNDVLGWIFAMEAHRLRHGDLPFGVTALVVGRKAAGAAA